MKCLSEIEIEEKILSAEQFSAEFKQHLFECYRCRELFLVLNEYYQNYDLIRHFDFGMDWLESASSAVAPKIIELVPLKTAVAGSPPAYRLAAMGDSATEKYLVFSFCNEHEGILGRVLQTKKNHMVTLYLIAEDMDRVKGLKVWLPDTNLVGITDNSGKVDFGPQEGFSGSSVQIQSPLAIFDLSPLATKSSETIQKHQFSLQSAQHDEIHIQIDKSSIQTNYQVIIKQLKNRSMAKVLEVIAFTSQERTLSQKAEKGITFFETNESEQILKIHIF